MADRSRAAGAVLEDGSGFPETDESAFDTLGLCVAPGRLVGIAMRIAERDEDQEAARGEQATGAAPAFEIAAIAETGEIATVLGRFTEEEIVAVWRRLGQASGLPLMLQNPDGSLSAPYPQIGPLALGETRQRRRHGLLSDRRPRFLTRRKTGRPASRPLVFREREIVCGLT
ncbi:DUF6101 family protein [Salinarimonas ramus]|nr:DUF6101 family protein [Salinarimonas ramus]